MQGDESSEDVDADTDDEDNDDGDDYDNEDTDVEMWLSVIHVCLIYVFQCCILKL